MKRKEFLVFSIMIFLTVIAWVVLNIISSRTEEHIKDTSVQIPAARKFDLDENVFTLLEARQE